jgi:hypothetical protein
MKVSGQFHAPAVLRPSPPGKSSWYPSDRRLVRLQNRFGRRGEEKASHHCPCQEFNPGRPARSLVSTLTELPQLLKASRCVAEESELSPPVTGRTYRISKNCNAVHRDEMLQDEPPEQLHVQQVRALWVKFGVLVPLKLQTPSCPRHSNSIRN